MSNDAFFKNWLGVSGKTYLETHGGKVDFETILSELIARKPARGELLALSADALRSALETYRAVEAHKKAVTSC